MARAAQLGNANLKPDQIATTATVKMEKLEVGWTLTAVHLDVTAKIPNATPSAFETAANNAKSGCPISRVLNARITMDAKLEA
jgi:osmotically inducible protein OsmC